MKLCESYQARFMFDIDFINAEFNLQMQQNSD